MNYEISRTLKLKALAELELRKRQIRRLSFQEWLRNVSPEFNWEWPHLKLITNKVDNIFDSPQKKIMISMPPRHGKTEAITIRFPAYFLEKHPDKRVISGAYNQTLINKFSRKTRRIVSARLELNPERTAVEDWETLQGGGLRAVGVGAGIAGMGANLIILDDPVRNREEANSVTYQEKIYDWYTDDIYTRLEPGGAIILIMTRWHESDLAGRILASEDGPNWEVINLPAIATENDILGRELGEALCPERFDVEALEKIRMVMGSGFEALYMGRPSAEEGQIFKRHFWRYYREMPHFERIVQSWDTAFKTKEDNDYSACTTWGLTNHGFYLIDFWMDKVEFPELKRVVKVLAQKFGPEVILVEDKSSGQSLIQELSRETRLPFKEVHFDIDKIARANSVTPMIEAGKVFLPENPEFSSKFTILEYINNHAAFPNAAHDDDVDSTTQALIYMRKEESVYFGNLKK